MTYQFNGVQYCHYYAICTQEGGQYKGWVKPKKYWNQGVECEGATPFCRLVSSASWRSFTKWLARVTIIWELCLCFWMLRSREYVCGSLWNSHWCPCEICIQWEVIPTGTANLMDWIKATERPVCPEKGSKTTEIRPEGVASYEAGSAYRALYDHCRPFQII